MANNASISNISIDLTELSADSSPQLGGNLDLNSNNITGTGNINTTGTITSSGNISTTGDLTLTSTDTGSSAAPVIELNRDSSSPADADYLGQIKFKGDDDGGSSHVYAKITGKIQDASAGTEDGLIEFANVRAGSTTITARLKSDKFQLLNSMDLEVAGNTTLTGTLNGHTIPSGTDTLLGRATTDTLTNKTINLASNTLSGTTAQFNTALSDGSFRVGYQPGEIIEQLETQADGNAVTVQSGTYTPTNVTATQDLSTSHAVINGSSIGYTPPTGTTRVIYEFWTFMRDTDVGPILHFAGRVAGTQVLNSRHTWREATSNADYQTWIYSKMVLRVGVTENLSAGDVGTWTSSKTLDFTAREYSSSYEGRFHTTNHWDGSGTDILVKPRIRITAIA